MHCGETHLAFYTRCATDHGTLAKVLTCQHLVPAPQEGRGGTGPQRTL